MKRPQKRKRQSTLTEAKGRCYGELLQATQRLCDHPRATSFDVRRVLAALAADWYGYNLTIGVEKS